MPRPYRLTIAQPDLLDPSLCHDSVRRLSLCISSQTHSASRVTAAYLTWRNSEHAKRRVALGKAGKIVDRSIQAYSEMEAKDGAEARNDQAFDDLTDVQNEDFIYVL